MILDFSLLEWAGVVVCLLLALAGIYYAAKYPRLLAHRVRMARGRLDQRLRVPSFWDRNVDRAFAESTSYLQKSPYWDEETGFILDQNVSHWLPIDKLPRGRLMNGGELSVLISKYVKPLAKWSHTKTRQGKGHVALGGREFDAKAQRLAAAFPAMPPPTAAALG